MLLVFTVGFRTFWFAAREPHIFPHVVIQKFHTMGSSESKLAVEIKPELPFKATRVHELLDPRSPSVDIDRTPIQLGVAGKSSVQVRSVCLTETDPRSPSVDISRTPVREVMRATVGTFARRLGMLFHSESENKAEQNDFDASVAAEEEDSKPEEMASTEPLLPPQPSDIGSLDAHATMAPAQNTNSPFVNVPHPQVEVELETEPDISLEEAEEARETPIHKRLSMSLIACHEGSTSLQIFDCVTNDSFANVDCADDSTPLIKEDHAYAVPSIAIQSPVEPSVVDDKVDDKEAEAEAVAQISSESKEEAAQSLPDINKVVEKSIASEESKAESDVPRPLHVRFPTIDPKSPSQIVFKPQWLGKGFGGAGHRVRGKGGSSPLALQVAVKKATNENKGHTGKAKSKASEGRSPLQTLKETNSPRARRAQIKLKTSTPEGRRNALGERRVISVAVDKEN